MARLATSQFAQPRIDARALLGLYDPQDGIDWGPIRAAQLNAGRNLALFLVAANVVGAVLAILVARTLVPAWMALLWCSAVTAAAAAIGIRRLSSRHHPRISAGLVDVRSTIWEGIVLGALWSVPPLGLMLPASRELAFDLWIVMTLLMTASAVAMAALPLATMTFLAMTGAALCFMVWQVSGPGLASAALLFSVLLMIGCFVRAKSLVALRAGEIALAERDETVSLLLRDSEEMTADWLWEIDAARRVCRASPRFAYATGLDPLKINQMPILQVLAGRAWESGKFSAGLRQLAEKLKQREGFHDLLLSVEVKGEQRWWELAASPKYDEAGTFIGFRGVGSDVTEKRESTEKINRLARFDTLTGLPNRLLIIETLTQALVEAQGWGSRCAFIMIDLDRFKAVNDTLGHLVGDRLLTRVAQQLQHLATDNELVGRLGGDEFAVVVRDATDTAQLERFADAIIDTLAQPYDIDGNAIHIGASLGIATGPRDGRNAETLIRSADLALYRSKEAGGGVFHRYEPQLHLKAEERRVLEIALRKALQNGELFLQYQPVVTADMGNLSAFEALVRWNSPEFGMVAPAKFVPLAEDTRLIGPIGDWVLRTACAEAARWPTSVRLAVNVSAEQLQSSSFVGTVASAIASSGLSPDRLSLEVTESIFVREGTKAIDVLGQILALGVKLSLDDFGTGYSSLGYLSRTQFSSIKIDRTFVQGASRGVAEAVAIVRAVVAMAGSLGMSTIAEGVETEEEHRFVRDAGCSNVQGFYFGRPLPAEEARAIAKRQFWEEDAA